MGIIAMKALGGMHGCGSIKFNPYFTVFEATKGIVDQHCGMIYHLVTFGTFRSFVRSNRQGTGGIDASRYSLYPMWDDRSPFAEGRERTRRNTKREMDLNRPAYVLPITAKSWPTSILSIFMVTQPIRA